MRLTEILSPLKTLTIHGTLVHVVQSSYGFVGRFSITNLSRWTFGKGGSLRTLERFFADSHDWNRYLISVKTKTKKPITTEKEKVGNPYFYQNLGICFFPKINNYSLTILIICSSIFKI